MKRSNPVYGLPLKFKTLTDGFGEEEMGVRLD